MRRRSPAAGPCRGCEAAGRPVISFPAIMNTAGRKQSARLFARAKRILPGGVDSPVRAFSAVGGTPPFIRRASGARIEDEDGRSYVDFVMSWGPLIHGHAPAGLTRVLAAAAKQGTSFGAPTAAEVELGTAVRELMPSLERVRFVNSGHRGGDERAAARAGRDGAQPGDQVRGVLSRPRRRVPGAGGVRGHHPSGSPPARGYRRRWRPTPSSRATTTSDRSTGCSAGTEIGCRR